MVAHHCIHSSDALVCRVCLGLKSALSPVLQFARALRSDVVAAGSIAPRLFFFAHVHFSLSLSQASLGLDARMPSDSGAANVALHSPLLVRDIATQDSDGSNQPTFGVVRNLSLD